MTTIMTATEQASPRARVADPDEDISFEELALATRNAGMPLEALRYPVTPVGLHYLLIHYDIPDVDPSAWRLEIDGHVRRPLSMRLDDIRARPGTTQTVTLECAGNGRARLRPRPVSQPWLTEAVGTARWTGTPLAPLLEEAGIRDGAVDVVFTGADHGIERGVEQDYARSLTVEDACREEVLLAYEVNGMPLPPQHGAPLRLIVPGWYGMAHVKWLCRITVADTPFEGFQQASAYRIKRSPEEAGEPVTRIRPRALMIPPGFPDFMSRTRFVDAGEHLLQGRAWSGCAPVTAVQVSCDGGATWDSAEVDRQESPYGWTAWRYAWRADVPGTYELCCRAADAAGNVQPVEQSWNRQGMANNSAQRVPVVVRAP